MTFSIIGTREPVAGRTSPACVISVEPSIRNNVMGNSSSLRGTTQPETGSRKAAAEKTRLWQQLVKIMPDKEPGIPNFAEAFELLLMPQQRDIPPYFEVIFRDTGLTVNLFSGLLLYLTGASGSCANCNDDSLFGAKVFKQCVALPLDASPLLKAFFGANVCSNCFVAGHPRPCVTARYDKAPESTGISSSSNSKNEGSNLGSLVPKRKRGRPSSAGRSQETESSDKDGDFNMRDTTDLQQDPPSNGERRSKRVQAVRARQIISKLAATSVNSTTIRPVQDSEPASQVTLPLRDHQSGKVAATEVRPDLGTLLDTLQIEDWEFAPGRIRQETDSGLTGESMCSPLHSHVPVSHPFLASYCLLHSPRRLP
jgi:hypothetical protein